MSKLKNRVATALALLFIFPFAAGLVHAAETEKSAKPVQVNAESPPTIDTNKDGKADGWDRDGNGMVDAWDSNGDNKPDRFDDDGDGKPDDAKAPPANPDSEVGQQ